MFFSFFLWGMTNDKIKETNLIKYELFINFNLIILIIWFNCVKVIKNVTLLHSYREWIELNFETMFFFSYLFNQGTLTGKTKGGNTIPKFKYQEEGLPF